ncbi:hypothetical protein KSP40_PGU011349 [Platanthera guangdongensis]|uniref:Uncharacterized protein n=1 Tax=Platanthera guangdongensis TaxID=2320717 RepID=A0ABR2MQ98_9ASPA
MENVSLIDVSLEDDLLIPSSSQGFGTHITLEAENIEKASRKLEQGPKPSESPVEDQKRYDRHHLRKSLAWDSAFFTSEGILNSEELALMNSTYCKSGITLPGIQEELRKSSESTSTLESDNRVLEQLEVNLFENVRVSIQKTLGSSNCSRMMVQSDFKEEKKPDARNSRSLEKIDASSKIKSKTPIASRRHFISRQQKEHTSKDRLVCPSHANGESKPLIKPTRVSCKTILPPSVPSKKSCMEITEIKKNAIKPSSAARQQSNVAFNKSIEALGITRGTTLSAKSKTPKSSTVGYTKENCRPIYARSSLVLSKASPTSSVDTVVSASSSTTSASINLGKSFEGSDAGSLSPPLSLSSSVGAYKYSGTLSRSCIYDQTKSDVNGDSGSRLARPSGLRIPRPTVGYFDKEKCLVRNSSKALQPSLPSNAPRNTGVNYITTSNKMRPSDLPTLRDRGLSKQALKSAEALRVPPTRIENRPEPCPIVNNLSSETATNIRKIDSNDEVASIDGVLRDQRTQHQSYRTHIQEENAKNDINVADRETKRAIH